MPVGFGEVCGVNVMYNDIVGSGVNKLVGYGIICNMIAECAHSWTLALKGRERKEGRKENQTKGKRKMTHPFTQRLLSCSTHPCIDELL